MHILWLKDNKKVGYRIVEEDGIWRAETRTEEHPEWINVGIDPTLMKEMAIVLQEHVSEDIENFHGLFEIGKRITSIMKLGDINKLSDINKLLGR